MGVTRLFSHKLLPWLIAVEIINAGRDHWKELDPRDRKRLAELLRKSKGRPQNLSQRDKTQLKEIAGRLQLLRFAGRAATAATVGRKRARKF